MQSLIDYQRKTFSQSGEEGIIARVFEVIGAENKLCCEFGAWDGIHLSNTRSFILDGWSALLIEGDRRRFQDLQRNYSGNRTVKLELAFVDASANSLARILERIGWVDRRFDLLSIDIDGLDFDHFSMLDQLPSLPRLVVVEVQPEHGANRAELLPSAIACHNIGQPLAAFVARGNEIGYRLICYFGGNAFFLSHDSGAHSELPTVPASHAWQQWYEAIKPADSEYLFARNIGLNDAHYCFNNPHLTADALGISRRRAWQLNRKCFVQNLRHRIR